MRLSAVRGYKPKRSEVTTCCLGLFSLSRLKAERPRQTRQAVESLVFSSFHSFTHIFRLCLRDGQCPSFPSVFSHSLGFQPSRPSSRARRAAEVDKAYGQSKREKVREIKGRITGIVPLPRKTDILIKRSKVTICCLGPFLFYPHLLSHRL